MAALLPALMMLAYFVAVMVLPISGASYTLYRRHYSAAWTIGVALASLSCGALGFWVALFVTARLVPPGHELIGNPMGLLGGLLSSLLVGVPVGTWGGAWGCAALIRRLG